MKQSDADRQGGVGVCCTFSGPLVKIIILSLIEGLARFPKLEHSLQSSVQGVVLGMEQGDTWGRHSQSRFAGGVGSRE